jgi:hypothetical protein
VVEIVDLSALVATATWIAFLIGCFVVGQAVARRTRRSRLRGLWPLIRQFLGYQNRWRLLAAQSIVFVVSFVLVLASHPLSRHGLSEQAGFFATAAQVLAGVVVAFVFGQYGDATTARAARPAIGVAVFLASLGLFAAIAAVTPSLPPQLGRWAFTLCVAAGAASLVTLLQLSVRLFLS